MSEQKTIEELKIRLDQHKVWLLDQSSGQRFVAKKVENLSSADLRYANLRYADLRYADLRYAKGFKFTPLQIVNTKFFVTIFDDHVVLGCRKINFDELKNFELNDCESNWDADEFKLNKKIITEMIRYYRNETK